MTGRTTENRPSARFPDPPVLFVVPAAYGTLSDDERYQQFQGLFDFTQVLPHAVRRFLIRIDLQVVSKSKDEK